MTPQEQARRKHAYYESHKDAWKRFAVSYYERHPDQRHDDYQKRKAVLAAMTATERSALWKRDRERPARREWMRLYMRSWRVRNAAHRAEYMRDWYRKNPEKARAAFERMTLARRGRIRTAGEHTYDQWLALVESYGFRCVYCGAVPSRLSPDHIVPVARGGTNDIENIVPSCGSCNRRKSSTSLIVFLRRTWETVG